MSSVGARLIRKPMNHLGYADNLCLLTMSIYSKLLQICEGIFCKRKVLHITLFYLQLKLNGFYAPFVLNEYFTHTV